MSQPASRMNLWQLLAVGVALPAFLAAANHFLLASSHLPDLSALRLCALVGFYVIQIGFIGWAVAVYIQPWPLRWIIYVWIMILVDLQLASMISSQGASCLATAVLAGQLGVVMVWGIQGSGHFAWRIPALLVLLKIYWEFYSLLVRLNQEPLGQHSVGWDGLLITQGVLLSLLCGVLRLRGYSLIQVAAESHTASTAGTVKVPLQFGIRDLLVWMTSLAVFLAIAKAGDLLTSRVIKQFYDPGLQLLFTIGISTALVLIVALWAALGKGSPAMRLAVLLALSLGTGTALAWYCRFIARRATIASWNYAYWHWYMNGYWWIGWMFLSSVLLAASLIIYRTLGYRLVQGARQPRGQPEVKVTTSPSTAELA